MAQRPAYFIAHVGPGCYMPDSSFGPYEIPSRRELVSTVDRVLEMLDCSARTRRQVDLVAVWRHIQAKGNGRAGFILYDAVTRTRVHFENMTREEAAALECDDVDQDD